MCVTSTSGGSESASTAKPWFCAVMSTRPGFYVLHGLIAAVMTEFQFKRPPAERMAEASGAPGRLPKMGFLPINPRTLRCT